MKRFITDKQTLEDLNLTGKYNPRSMFSMFNKVRTAGAERLLDDMFRNPLTEAAAINRRSVVFQYYQQKNIRFELEATSFREAEAYLTSAGGGSMPSILASMVSKKMLASATRDERYGRLVTGIQSATALLQKLQQLLPAVVDYPYAEDWELTRRLLSDQRLSWIQQYQAGKAIPVMELAKRHHLFREVFQQEMEQLLEVVYRLEVNIVVAGVAGQQGFVYAQAVEAHDHDAQTGGHLVKKQAHVLKEGHVLKAGDHAVRVEGLRHPALVKGVANDLSFDGDHNLLFLTGANMAGKSTLMKAFGIAIYMAHMGFPVAVTSMTFSVCDGLFTSINVPDNLNMGYSHFYAEVLRVKGVAEQVSSGANLVVIFDELFKGTNVKDAYDATLSVTKAFALYRNCSFIISTHIIEVGEALRAATASAIFRYMPTVMEGTVPRYPYTLTEGITNDRQGMMIIENEGVFEMLN